MMRNLTVSNHPAYTPGEASKGVDGRFSRVIYFNDGGVQRRITYHPAVEALDPRLDNKLIQSHRHHTGPTGMQHIEQIIPEGYVAAGANPYHQIIQRILGKDKVYTAETIYNRLVTDYEVFPDTGSAWDMLLYLIDEMHRYGYLNREVDVEERLLGLVKIRTVRYKIGTSIQTQDAIYKWKHGYDPIMYHMAEVIERSGGEGCPVERIRNEFIHRRYWLKNDREMSKYLKVMKKKGYIIETPQGYLKLINPVQPFKR